MKPMNNDALIATLTSPHAHHAYCIAGDQREINDIIADVCKQLAIPHSEQWHPSELPLTIAEARLLKKWASQAPQNGTYKMAHIPLGGVHLEAVNALLKLMEEPPTYVKIIISIHSLQELMPTITSRCVTLALNSQVVDDHTIHDAPPLPDAQELLNAFVALPDLLKEKKAIDQIHTWLTELEPHVRKGQFLSQSQSLLECARDASSNVNERILLENAFLIRYSNTL